MDICFSFASAETDIQTRTLITVLCTLIEDVRRSSQSNQPAIQRVQALADISHSALLCCHCNETRAPIANPPNSAQLEGTRYHSPKLHPGPYSSVGMRRGPDRQTHRRPWPIYISTRLCRTRNANRSLINEGRQTASRATDRINPSYLISEASR